MPDYKIGTREEWQAARDELAKLEAEQAKLDQTVTKQRRQLPWVPVGKYGIEFPPRPGGRRATGWPAGP